MYSNYDNSDIFRATVSYLTAPETVAGIPYLSHLLRGVRLFNSVTAIRRMRERQKHL